MIFKTQQQVRAELQFEEIVYYYENIQLGPGNRFLNNYENLPEKLDAFLFFE